MAVGGAKEEDVYYTEPEFFKEDDFPFSSKFPFKQLNFFNAFDDMHEDGGGSFGGGRTDLSLESRTSVEDGGDDSRRGQTFFFRCVIRLV